ncbi:MAG: CdaR family protein [Eubacteriales bacterium]|nr:CdaR family protein [Eubacteriales bacterium]
MEGKTKISLYKLKSFFRKDFFKRDIVVKVISILFAVIFWLYVLSNVNPYDVAYISVPIRFLNEAAIAENSLEIINKNYQKEITVAVEGRADIINTIDSSYFEATADFAGITESGRTEIKIDFKSLKDNVNVKNYNPVAINLEIDSIEERMVSIGVRAEGSMKEKYTVVGSSVTPDIISVRGLQSMIRSIDQAYVSVDVTGLDKDITLKKDCKFFNSAGEEIVSLSGKYIMDVSITVAKEVPVVPVVQGRISSGFVEKERLIYPQTILITGAADVLSGIAEIRTYPVNVDGATGNVEQRVGLNIPEGVTLYNSSAEAGVSVIVDQLATREFILSSSEITLEYPGDVTQYKIEIITQTVSLVIRGMREEIESVEQSKLTPTAYVNYITEGKHRLPLDISLPGDVKMTEDVFIEIIISKTDESTPTRQTGTSQTTPTPSAAPSATTEPATASPVHTGET